MGGLVGPRAGLDKMEKRKFLTLPGLELRPIYFISNLILFSPQSVVIETILFLSRQGRHFFLLLNVQSYTGSDELPIKWVSVTHSTKIKR
jgi:hypothetical protein